MGRRGRFKDWDVSGWDGQVMYTPDRFGLGEDANSRRRAGGPRRRAWEEQGRQTGRRIEVYRCPHCHKPYVSTWDLRDHLVDCGSLARLARH